MTGRRAFPIALAALVAGGLVAVLLADRLGHAWLAALFFWSGVPVGSILYLLMMALVGGTWRTRLGGAMARGAAGLPAVIVAAVPLLLLLPSLYPWAAETQPGFRGAWLQPWAFVLRTALWLSGLGGLAWLLRRGAGGGIAAAGLIFLVLGGSLIAVDWLMSLDPDFHSSGFGLQALSVQASVALMVAAIRSIRASPDPSGTTGALMLTLMMLWGYFAYLPFFIVWSGNVPAGAAWYLARATGGWGAAAGAAVLLHAVPLLALLSGRVRRLSPALIACAALSLAGDALQSAWLVLPARGGVTPAGMLAFALALLLIGAPVLLAGARR